MKYQTPELFEAGMAGDLTLGRPDLPCNDACRCTMAASDTAEDCVELVIQL